MTWRRRVAGIAVTTWLLAAAHVLAHHSLTGQFDPSKSVTLKGVITRVRWENPHVWIHIDVAQPNGAVVNWAVECAPLGVLRSSGVDRTLVKIGDRVTISAYRARASDEALAHAFDVVLPDGRRVVIGRKL